MAGGGGRDSTSLEPRSCTPPRNYRFEGEWKIDMASDARDSFGWEYYAGKYDGLGRRRRRWLRTLRRMHGAGESADRRKWKGSPARAALAPGVLQAIKNQYNFKGFGWSFFKSLVWAQSMGASLRIPISANFDAYDRYLAAPYVSSATYFGFPWVAAFFLSASVPMEALKWLVGGIFWKVRWGAAVLTACAGGIIEALIWTALRPWRLGRATTQVGSLAIRQGLTDPEKDAVDSGNDEPTQNTTEPIEGTVASIDAHIEPNASHELGVAGGAGAISAAAVADGPRGGGASQPKPRTVFGREVPAFNRPYALEYSPTVQERVGVVVSWRLSQERGYEYRCNLVYTCLPTMLFWGRMEAARKRRVAAALRRVGIWDGERAPVTNAKDGQEGESDKAGQSSSSHRRASSHAPPPILGSFWRDHSAALGINAGWPMPVDPYFNCSLMLTLSGFFYGWVLKYLRWSLVPSQTPAPRSADEEVVGRNATAPSEDLDGGERLVSSALKNI